MWNNKKGEVFLVTYSLPKFNPPLFSTLFISQTWMEKGLQTSSHQYITKETCLAF